MHSTELEQRYKKSHKMYHVENEITFFYFEAKIINEAVNFSAS